MSNRGLFFDPFGFQFRAFRETTPFPPLEITVSRTVSKKRCSVSAFHEGVHERQGETSKSVSPSLFCFLRVFCLSVRELCSYRPWKPETDAHYQRAKNML
jgi:hypothetical protein